MKNIYINESNKDIMKKIFIVFLFSTLFLFLSFPAHALVWETPFELIESINTGGEIQVVGNDFYFAPGGSLYSADDLSFWKYDMDTGLWTSLADLPNPIYSPGSCYSAVLFTEYSPSQNMIFFLTRYISIVNRWWNGYRGYNISTNTWTDWGGCSDHGLADEPRRTVIYSDLSYYEEFDRWLYTGKPLSNQAKLIKFNPYYSPSTNETIVYNTTLTWDWGIFVWESPYVYHLGENGNFRKFHTVSNTTTYLPSLPGTPTPGKLWWYEYPNLYVVTDNAYIYVYSLTAGNWSLYETLPFNVSNGSTLHYNSETDELYIALWNTTTVYRTTAVPAEITYLDSYPIANPFAIATDTNWIYVGDANTVRRYDYDFTFQDDVEIYRYVDNNHCFQALICNNQTIITPSPSKGVLMDMDYFNNRFYAGSYGFMCCLDENGTYALNITATEYLVYDSSFGSQISNASFYPIVFGGDGTGYYPIYGFTTPDGIHLYPVIYNSSTDETMLQERQVNGALIQEWNLSSIANQENGYYVRAAERVENYFYIMTQNPSTNTAILYLMQNYNQTAETWEFTGIGRIGDMEIYGRQVWFTDRENNLVYHYLLPEEYPYSEKEEETYNETVTKREEEKAREEAYNETLEKYESQKQELLAEMNLFTPLLEISDVYPTGIYLEFFFTPFFIFTMLIVFLAGVVGRHSPPAGLGTLILMSMIYAFIGIYPSWLIIIFIIIAGFIAARTILAAFLGD